MYLSDIQALAPYTTTKSFIRALLNPKPTRRLTAEQALLYTWLTSFAARPESPNTTCGLRENFRTAIGTAYTCRSSRKVVATAERNGWHSALTMKVRAEAGRRRGARRWNQTPETTTSSPQSPNGRAPRRGLAGLVV